MTGVAVALIAVGPVLGVFISNLAARKCREEQDLGGDVVRGHSNAPLAPDGSVSAPSSSIMPGVAGLVLSVVAVFAGQSDTERALGALFLLLLLGLFLTDRACLRLPDVMTAPLFAVGLGLGALSEGLWLSLTAAAVGSGSLWAVAMMYELLRKREGLGFGDVKMMAGVSAGVGLAAIPWVILVAALIGLVSASQTGKATSQSATQIAVPFGCALSIASGAVWLLS